MRKTWTRLVPGVLVALATAGCQGGPGLVAPIQAEARVVGDFTATSAVFTNVLDAGTSFDVISQDGELTFAVDGTGRFARTLLVPGRAVVSQTGTVQVVGNTLVVSEDGTTGTRGIPFTLNGNTLTFIDTGVAFDFNGEGVAVPAVLDVVFVR